MLVMISPGCLYDRHGLVGSSIIVVEMGNGPLQKVGFHVMIGVLSLVCDDDECV